MPARSTAFKILLAIPAAILLFGLAAAAGVPWLLQRQIAAWNAQHPELGLSLQQAHYQPYSANLVLQGLALSGGEAAAGQHLQVERLELHLAIWSSLLGRRLHIQAIDIATPHLAIRGDGQPWLGLLGSPSGEADSLALQIDHLRLQQGRLHYPADSTPATWQLDNIALHLENYASPGAQASQLSLQAIDANGAKIAVQAKLSPQPFALDAQLQLDGLDLPSLWPYLQAQLPHLKLQQGKASLAISIHYNGQGWSIGPGDLHLEQLALIDTTRQAPLLQAPAVELHQLRLDWRQRRLACASISASQAQLAAWQEADGSLNYAHYLAPADNAAASSSPAWSYQLGRIALHDSQLHWQDAAGMALQLAPLSMEAGPLGNNNNGSKHQPFSLHWDSPVNGQGRLQVQLNGGDAAGWSAQIQAERLPLLPLNAYVQSQAAVELADGNLDLQGRLDYPAGEQAPLSFEGTAAIRQLAAKHQRDGQALLQWQELAIKGLQLSYPGDGLRAAEIIAQRPYARIAIEADQTLNWAKLGRDSGQPAAASAGPALPVHIAALRIHDGVVDFADHTLQSGFAATVHKLDGTIKGLSSAPQARARLLLEGAVDQYSPVRVQGTLNPFRAGAYTDLEVHFHNLDLTRLSPYSSKFAGYRIDKGKLTLDLRYRLENRKLQAENQVIMDHLVLGEKVPSQTATSLPVSLAIALLRDGDGKIDIHLPISGNLDDPQFSLRGLYAQAITGLFTKLVTSPFAVLSNVLEGEAEEYGRVAFFPGQNELSDQQKNKLRKLAEALRQHNSLNLEIRGIADAERDRAALAKPAAAVGDAELRLLAQQRAAAIREFLVREGGIEERRVYLLDVQLASPPGRELESVLMLSGSSS